MAHVHVSPLTDNFQESGIHLSILNYDVCLSQHHTASSLNNPKLVCLSTQTMVLSNNHNPKGC